MWCMLCCRLCSLTLSRLVVLKALGSDLNSITIAVKMQVKLPVMSHTLSTLAACCLCRVPHSALSCRLCVCDSCCVLERKGYHCASLIPLTRFHYFSDGVRLDSSMILGLMSS